jgi:hypothetical protein
MREFERAGFTLEVDREWYLVKGFQAAEIFMQSMVERHWASFVSTGGNFIGSDNPVVLDGPKGEKVGCKSADFMLFPVGRHVILVSTKVPIRSGAVVRRQIAHHNTFTMLTADEQIYSHTADFCWEDEAGRYQTDWRLFSKERFL